MEALYRKYRPSTFSDVVGQEHIERTLKNALAQDKVSHAYLFCGPRGTGKTTMARILAKALLCEKAPTGEPDGTCSECQAIANGTHPDVYELDAASRTGVENVREEIISRVNYAPTRGKWKVYVIDEVHMLSTAAFNALLKTLEEPPAHVVFILCTTDPQKVPETIHSRCQRFDFHRISAESIVSRLGAVCVEEGVDFEGEALDLIAYRSDGGMRNALTSLEQLMAFGGGHVTLEGAQNLLGSLDDTDLSEIVIAIGRRDAAACFNWVARYVETGADLAQFVGDLAEYVRNLYLLSMAGLEVEIPVSEAARKAMVDQLPLFGQDRLARMLSVLDDLQKELHTSSNPRLSFEIALTRMIRPDSDLTLAALAERIEALEARLAKLAEGGVAAQVRQGSAPAPGASPAVPAAAPRQAQAQAQAEAPAMPVQPRSEAACAPAPAAPTAQAVSSSPQPAVRPAAPAAQPASTQGGTVDLANPASLQRFWHTVAAALRKANPARGVLFMNAKVQADEAGSGVVLTFTQGNEFAYKAASKPEVQELLAQTIAQVAGAPIPFRLVNEGSPTHTASQPVAASQPAAAPKPVAAAQPAAAAPASAPQPATAPASASQPVAVPASVPSPVPEAVPDDEVPLDMYDSLGSDYREKLAVPVPPAPADAASSASADEAQAIRDVLTNSFGEGVKFQEMD